MQAALDEQDFDLIIPESSLPLAVAQPGCAPGRRTSRRMYPPDYTVFRGARQ
ncbi:MAG: hypothetical protein MUO42_11345 [Anaerolineaceae bacterium]|nr:hypothetical protein [Anaerolineaceae bacterium]